MPKKKTNSLADEEMRLKTKVRDRRGKLDNPEGDASFRKLHKRLKRLQRLRRRLAIRKQHAMGSKKTDTGEKPAAPAA